MPKLSIPDPKNDTQPKLKGYWEITLPNATHLVLRNSNISRFWLVSKGKETPTDMIQRSLPRSSELIGPCLCMSPPPPPVSLWSTFEVQSHLAYCLPLCVVGTVAVSPYLPLLAHCLAQGLNSESERFPGGRTFLCQRRWAASHGRNWASGRRWEIRRSHLPGPRIREELEIFLNYQESAFRLAPQGGMTTCRNHTGLRTPFTAPVLL